jgi:hypothetical protein
MMSLRHKRKPPNIQMQWAGIITIFLGIKNLSAADLGQRSKIGMRGSKCPCSSPVLLA